tara:strand:- start:1887 stop:2177 length:291 start_codon:yes stop_codon:yes gene_type:complete
VVNASVHFRFCFLARRWIGRDSGDGSVYDGLHPTFINRVSSNVRPMGGIVPEMTGTASRLNSRARCQRMDFWPKPECHATCRPADKDPPKPGGKTA